MNSRAAFVLIGLAVNMLALIRGVFLMIWLDYAGLGLVALMQSVVMFGGMLHFGLLNGGYRLLCHAGSAYRQRLVDLAYSYFALLFVGFAICGAIAIAMVEGLELQLTVALTAAGAIATLIRAWMINELVALGSLKAVNLLNGLSMAISVGVLAFIRFDPVKIAILSIAIQPISFAVLAFGMRATMRPGRIWWSKRLAKLILRAGFLLFVAGIALQLNTQMERWYVGSYLGLESLGRLYLAFLFLTLFLMVPTLLDQVFLPNVVKARNASALASVRREVRLLFAIYLAYSGIAIAGVWLLAEPVLTLVLPDYVDDLRFVKLLVPGLVIFAMSNPFALVFNVLIDYRWYLWAYGLGTVATGAAFAAAMATGHVLDLDQTMILRSAIFALIGAVLILGWWRLTARHREFRLFGSLGSPDGTGSTLP